MRQRQVDMGLCSHFGRSVPGGKIKSVAWT